MRQVRAVPGVTDAPGPPGADEANRTTDSSSDGPRVAALGRSYLVTLGGSGGMLVCNLFTGVVSARLLAPEGRGVVGAIAAWAVLVAFICGLGFREGMSYLESKDHTRAARVLTATSVSIFFCAAIGIAFAEALIPFGFRAQSAEAVRYARIFMIWVLPYVAYNSFGSILGARQRFLAVTVMRVGQPFLYAVGLGVLWMVDAVGVVEVLAVQVASFALCALGSFVALTRESGLGPFDRELVGDGARYGVTAFGSTLGILANTRLDQMVLPAFVAADEIGLYVVAVSAASMVVGLFGSLSLVVFPAASRAGGAEAVAMTQRAIRLVFLLSAAVAVVLGVSAELLVRFLYGAEFDGSVVPLRLLLPGICMWAGSTIVGGGINALGRPGLASMSQFIGVVITVVGLVVTLPTWGIVGAALTSTVSYSVVFVVMLSQFGRISGTRLGETFSIGAIGADVRSVASEFRRTPAT